MSRKQSVGYYFIIVLLLFLPLLRLIFPLIGQLNEDSQEIADNIPEFTIEDNSLVSENESYIHKTDTLLFSFDPEGTINNELVDRNIQLNSAPIAISLLKENLNININGTSQNIPYEQMESFDHSTIKSIFYEISNTSPIATLVFSVISIIGLAFSYLFEFLPVAIIAYMIALFTKMRMRFGNVSKMILVSYTLPTVMIALFNLFGFSSLYDPELRMIFTLILFGVSLHEFKNKTESE